MNTDGVNYHSLDPDYDPNKFHKLCVVKTLRYCYLRLYDYEDCRAVESRESQLWDDNKYIDEDGWNSTTFDLFGSERDIQVCEWARKRVPKRFSESIIGYYTVSNSFSSFPVNFAH